MPKDNKVFAAWEKAMKNGEYLWAKELSAVLYYNAPDNNEARQAHADSLRKLAQYSEGMIVRNFYMAGVKSLETGAAEVGLTETVKAEFVSIDTVDLLRTRINPAKSAGVSGKLAFKIDGKMAQLEIRNSIAEFSTTIADDAVVLELSKEQFGQYFEGTLKANQIASGTALKLLSVFDEYEQITLYPRNFNHLN